MISGDGPCNQGRIERRTQAHEDGAWVREAAAAHAARRRDHRSDPITATTAPTAQLKGVPA